MLQAVNRHTEQEQYGTKGNSQAIHYLTCHLKAPICTVVLNTCLLWLDHFLMAMWGGWCDSQQGSHSLLPAAPARTMERGTAFGGSYENEVPTSVLH